jgi:hypothetical protein
MSHWRAERSGRAGVRQRVAASDSFGSLTLSFEMSTLKAPLEAW